MANKATSRELEQRIRELEKEAFKRKKAEEAIIQAKEDWERTFDALPDLIAIIDKSFKIIRANKAMAEKMSMTPDELIGLVCYEEIHGTKEPPPFCPHVKLLADGHEYSAEVHEDRLNGDFLVTVSPIYGTDGHVEGCVHVAHDITDRKQVEEEKENLQAQLSQAQRMEAIGNLAGGVAHDFNNLLVGILGRCSLMLNEIDTSHPFYNHLKQIEDYVTSASDLTGQLLGFARGGKYEVESTDLNDLLTRTSKIFSRTRKELKVYTRYQDDVWGVEVDRSQIEQVLLNLYVNAWQAMPGGGHLYLETENMTLDKNMTRSFTVDPGRYVKISITDTGVGMDKQIQKRIFEPFFTSRENGRGLGLGLASAYGIIKNHDGMISVYSEKGQGTTFNIYLPATEEEAIQMEDVAYEIKKGTESVLIVDDEDVPRDVAKEILEKLGYAVLVARSGKEAIEICSSKSVAIDLVILDMIMPEMGGGETFDRLKEIDPEIRVLLSSGYTINGQAQDILDRGCKGFLQKPYHMTALSHKIREILDEK
jgi:PAS domain S-box-containing protein